MTYRMTSVYPCLSFRDNECGIYIDTFTDTVKQHIILWLLMLKIILKIYSNIPVHF